MVAEKSARDAKHDPVEISQKVNKCEYCPAIFEGLGDEKLKFYSCPEKTCSFYVCEMCHLKTLTRRKLVKQT
jgi:hypothetical protein